MRLDSGGSVIVENTRDLDLEGERPVWRIEDGHIYRIYARARADERNNRELRFGQQDYLVRMAVNPRAGKSFQRAWKLMNASEREP